MDAPPPTLDPAVYDAPLRRQFDAFLDDHRQILLDCLDGLTEEQARRRLVPSRTTLLSLLKHATFVERVWFDEAVTCRPRAEIGIPESQTESFDLDDADTVASVRAAYRAACDDSRRAIAGWGSTTCCPATGAARCRCAGSCCTCCASWPSTAATPRSCASRCSPPTPDAAVCGPDLPLAPARGGRLGWMTTDERPSMRATSVTVMTPEPLRLADFYARLLGTEVSHHRAARRPARPRRPASPRCGCRTSP